jgi:RNA-binding protein 5/10
LDGLGSPATPDTSQFTYDASSGYYYDASTNLYYDASSQYFYNSEINQFLYWDPLKSTYILAPAEGADSASTAQQVGFEWRKFVDLFLNLINDFYD